MEEITQQNLESESVVPPKSSVVGDLRLHELRSNIFRNTRLLRVWVPPEYDAAENKERYYPVFYLNDGQNLFDPAVAFIGVDWQVDETADRLGISIQYAAAWARQQENFMMAIGVDGARALPPRLQELIGYSIHPPFMGMIDGRHPKKILDHT